MKKRRLVLLMLEGCPYCRRAEDALEKKGIQYEKFYIDPDDRSLVQRLSGQPTVPVLLQVIGSENQDDDIVEYIGELAK